MQRHVDTVAARVAGAVEAIARHTSLAPALGIILGSGQGGFSRRLLSADYIPFAGIPHFYQPLVPGHEGILSIGLLEGQPVAVLEGRIHQYEGYFMREIVFPVRVLAALGARELVVCNAAGSLTPRLGVGRVMAVADHLNLMGQNPLTGQIHQATGGSTFLDMRETYDPRFRSLARETAEELGEDLAEGVLAAVPGPCFETPAESRMLAGLGADAVTMSTVPEVIMARFLGLKVLGLSLITNTHDGTAADHREVLSVAHRRTGFLMELIARTAVKIRRNG
jgi:purine-nucleoside phosphorylase